MRKADIPVSRYFFAILATVLALDASAAYRRGELLWRCDFTPEEAVKYDLASKRLDPDGTGCAYLPDGGPSGGGAMMFKTVGVEKSSMVNVKADITMPPVVLVEADVQGVDLERGERPHLTSKVVFNCKLAPEGKHRHVSLEQEVGTFDWKTWTGVRDFPDAMEGVTVVLGNHLSSGEFRVASLRIYRAEEVPDENVVAPFNEAAAKIPRGPFAGGRHNPEALRGTMSGRDMGEESVRNLAGWGANLVRIAINVPGARTMDAEEFFKAFETRLDEYAAIVDRCHRNGIRAVINLASVPPDGVKVSKNASNLLEKGYDTTYMRRAWRILATRFRDHPAVIAYDIMNEPRCEPDEWRRIFREAVEDLRKVDAKTPVVTEFVDTWWPEEMNVIYSPHFYQPHDLTHCGVGGLSGIRWSYPGYINGIYWDKEQMRVALKPWIDFQRAHPGTRILVGEFSCVLWSKGADQWIHDAIEIFEEYGWSWCYHIYREWQAWDVEYTHDPDWTIGKWRKADEDTARKKELLKGLSYNGCSQDDNGAAEPASRTEYSPLPLRGIPPLGGGQDKKDLRDNPLSGEGQD